MKKFDKKTDPNLIKRSAYELADSTASSIPGLAQAWALSKALYGNALELRQQRALEWVEAISNDPSDFSEELVKSEEFQDGFVVALEGYIKLRNFLKRRVAVKMFKEFAVAEDKVEFQLERYNDTLLKISTASIKTLAFIKAEILPMRIQGIKDDLATKNLGTEKDYNWWYEQRLKTEPISTYHSKWIDDRYSPNSQAVKDEYNEGKDFPSGELLTKVFDIEREVRDRMNAPLAELEYLGLIKWVNDPGGLGWSGGGGSSSWILTNFAYEFIKFIESSPEEIEAFGITASGRTV